MSAVFLKPKSDGPKQRPSQQLLNGIGNLVETARPLPLVLPFEKFSLHIDDLVPFVTRFTVQLHQMAARNLGWPCARFTQRDHFSDENDDSGKKPLVHRWVPVDLSEENEGLDVVGESEVDMAEVRIAEMGLLVERRSVPEVFNSFRERLGEDIMSRFNVASNASAGLSPPFDDPVQVTTDSHRLDVLYSIGPFLSTQQGFGLSSPAKRNLRPGSYCFGVGRSAGGTWFSDTIWDVPETKEVHLRQ